MSRRAWLAFAVCLLLCAAGWYAYKIWWVSPRGNPVPVGDKAPDFELKDTQGKAHTLASLTKDGPALIIFYRGHW